MANLEERIGLYYFYVETEELAMNPKSRDSCRPYDCFQHCSNYFSYQGIIRASTIFETSTLIIRKSFFENDQEFLQSFISNPQCSRKCFPSSLDQISHSIISQVQQLFELPSDPEFADTTCQEFPFTLVILVDVMEDEDSVQ